MIGARTQKLSNVVAVMKKDHLRTLRIVAFGLCLATLMANSARATVTYWDPQGTTGSNPFTGDMSGKWETMSWSTVSTGEASPQAWVEGTAACFGVNTGLGTPAFTVLINSNHSCAGIFDGPLNPNSCTVTIYGPGIMTLPAGLDAFDVINSSDGASGLLTVSNVLAGPGV